MEYQEIRREVERLPFVRDEQQADHMVKAALGILASRMEEDDAKRLTEDLPEPLTIERLRGMQRNPIRISYDEFLAEIATQFRLTMDEADVLAGTVLHAIKQAVGRHKVEEAQRHLPADWAQSIAAA